MPTKILITGITGSGGSYLAECMLNNYSDVDIYGICRWHSTTTTNNLNSISDKIKIFECDLLDFGSIIRTLQDVKPDKIFHLAAYANVRKCFDTPISVINNNIIGTANLLESVRMICPDCILQICSTSEVYGNPEITPITEEHALKPVNPYASSKLAQESLGYAYYKSWDLNIVITRMFAYLNPRRYDLFASAFAIQIAKIEQGKQDVLKHGNLNSIRTLIDVRDAMESYWIASDCCKYGEPYNIGGNFKVSVGDFLDILKSKASVPIKSVQDPNLMRPIDITNQVPDVTKFNNTTDWRPRYSQDESIEFLLDECRKKVKNDSV